ncbi:MAG TPA: potassium-transporting ATPase subunit KdpC [Armatimonadota bacterium]|jgi:K+-transporting ATPase ATPase C chain
MLQHVKTSIVLVLAMAVLCGLLFPAVITGAAQLLFPGQAHGSLISQNGKVIGSELIGQSFTDPGYFHPRPSAAGRGYDATASGGTNLGPTSAKLYHDLQDLAASYRRENGLPSDAPLPADAVTRSASGLDPDISPANAALQASRVARARGLGEEQVRGLVAANTQGRAWGFLGEPRVNVLLLNLALDREIPPHG